MDSVLPEPKRWHITLLGALRAVRGEGRSLERFQTQKTAALFAYLALYAGRPHRREALADLIWPDADAENGRRSLSQAASWLRQRLEPPDSSEVGTILSTDRQHCQLNVQNVSVDANVFEAALQAAERITEPTTRAEALRQAVSLYTGELLPGFYDDWVLTERRRLADAYLRALQRLISGYEGLGQAQTALQYANAALVADPGAEEAHAARIRLLALLGQKAAALRQYDDWERRLREERDEKPSPALRALAERIRRGETAPPAERAEVRQQLTLIPTPLTRLFGREEEIAGITSLIATEGARLITLTGSGGAGKTRLSVECARRLSQERFADHVLFFPLADLSDPSLVTIALADAVRRAESGMGMPRSDGAVSAWDILIERFSPQPFLLILDNLEHLLNSAASDDRNENEVTRLVRQLLEKIPSLTLLVTSRQRLAIDGEQEVPVPPLPVPLGAPGSLDAQSAGLASASVLLFTDRARTARPDFHITDANAAAVAEICARLEGIPLAIELCAAWAQVLSPAQMLTKLAHRFDLLISRRADIAPRHRTLRGAIEYSYQMLPREEKRLFTHLSVFQGGWTLETAESVLTSLLDDPESEGNSDSLFLLSPLTELRERSLLVAEETLPEGEMRYRMLETLREFAGQQLTYAEAKTLRGRHAESFLDLAEQAEANLSGPEQGIWLTRLEAEHENLRAALGWVTKEDVGIGLRLAGALGPFWDTRGYLTEGRDWLNRLLSMVTAKSVEVSLLIQARAWSALGRLARSQGDFADAKTATESALTLWRAVDDARGVAATLYDLGSTIYRLGDYETARDFIEQSLNLFQAQDDASGRARAFNLLGNLASADTSQERARGFYQASFDAAESQKDRQLMATALHNLGTVAGDQKDYEKADALFERALAIRRDLKDDYGVMTTVVNLGKTALLQERWPDAHRLMTEATLLAQKTGRKHVLAYCLKDLGMLAFGEKRDSKGVQLLAAALRLAEEIHAPMTPRLQEEYTTALTAVRERLGDAAYESAWTAGRAAPITQIIDELRQEERREVPPPNGSVDKENGAHCVYCGSTRLIRRGYATNGKQRYQCADCGKSQRDNPESPSYDPSERARILAARREGASLRDLTRRFGISRNTVLAWLKEEEPQNRV